MTLFTITNHSGRTGSTGKSSSVRQVEAGHPWIARCHRAWISAPAILSISDHSLWTEPTDVAHADTHPHVDAADIVEARIGGARLDRGSAFHPVPFETLWAVAALSPALRVVAKDSGKARLVLEPAPVYLTGLPVTHSAIRARPTLDLTIGKL